MECFGNVTWRSVWFEFCEFGVTIEELDPLRLNIIYPSILPFRETPLLSLALMVLSYKFLEIYIVMLEYIEEKYTKYAAVFIGMEREYKVCHVQNFMVIDVKLSMTLLGCWLQLGHWSVVFFGLNM